MSVGCGGCSSSSITRLQPRRQRHFGVELPPARARLAAAAAGWLHAQVE